MSQPSPYAEHATAIATRIVYELTGRRWVWPAITTTETVDLDPWPNYINLDGRPVIEVLSVIRTFPDGMAQPLEYTLENGYRVRLTGYIPANQAYVTNGDPAFYNSQYFTQNSLLDPNQLNGPFLTIPDRRIAVTYRYGSPPPKELQWAIDVLANELTMAMNGDDECRLPDRVTSVTRQGITTSLLSIDHFLENGYTGIPEVDQALRTYNPARSMRRARVYSPSSPPARRTNTTQAPS
jgi:hypothetical protein